MSSNPFLPSVREICASPRFAIVRNEALVLAIHITLGGSEGYFRKGDVARDMTLLIRDGVTFISEALTEFGRWDRRSDGIDSLEAIADDCYFGFVDPGWPHDHDPNLVAYSKAEFMEIFEDVCRNFVVRRPERREEFRAALSANGMSL